MTPSGMIRKLSPAAETQHLPAPPRHPTMSSLARTLKHKKKPDRRHLRISRLHHPNTELPGRGNVPSAARFAKVHPNSLQIPLPPHDNIQKSVSPGSYTRTFTRRSPQRRSPGRSTVTSDPRLRRGCRRGHEDASLTINRRPSRT